MISVRRLAAVSAAVLSVALGVMQAGLRLSETPAEPPAAGALAALARAPIPAGAAVAILLPDDLPRSADSPLLLEAAWQRPDLRWSVVGVPRHRGAPSYLVAVAGAASPPGWRTEWRHGIVSVLVPEGR